MKAIAYVRETDETSFVPYDNERRLIDQQCAMAGITHIIIDKTQTMRKTNNNVFYSFDELFEAFPDHKFVLLDVNAAINYNTYNHTDENVIFCVGEDETGWAGVDITGKDTYRVTTYNDEVQWHSLNIAFLIVSDLVLRLS